MSATQSKSSKRVKTPDYYAGMGLQSELVWDEFLFRSVEVNRYRVTVAAVVLNGKVYFGASACAPEDFKAKKFSRADGANRAIARARETAFYQSATHCASDSGLCLGMHCKLKKGMGITLFEMVRVIALHVAEIVGARAERVAVQRAVKHVLKAYGNRYDYVVDGKSAVTTTHSVTH